MTPIKEKKKNSGLNNTIYSIDVSQSIGPYVEAPIRDIHPFTIGNQRPLFHILEICNKRWSEHYNPSEESSGYVGLFRLRRFCSSTSRPGQFCTGTLKYGRPLGLGTREVTTGHMKARSRLKIIAIDPLEITKCTGC